MTKKLKKLKMLKILDLKYAFGFKSISQKLWPRSPSEQICPTTTGTISILLAIFVFEKNSNCHELPLDMVF